MTVSVNMELFPAPLKCPSDTREDFFSVEEFPHFLTYRKSPQEWLPRVEQSCDVASLRFVAKINQNLQLFTFQISIANMH